MRLSVGGGVPATVREVVSSGRVARQSRFRLTSRADRDAVRRAMESLGIAHLAGQSVLVLHELGPLEPLITHSVVLEDGRIVHRGAAPEPSGECAKPGHDHVHPHAEPEPVSLWRALVGRTGRH